MYVNITFGQIFDIAQIKRPDIFTELFDTEIKEIATDNNWIDYRSEGLKILFVFDYDRIAPRTYEKLARDGVVIISYKPVQAPDGSEIKTVVFPNFVQLRNVWIALGKYIRRQFDIPTIAVTGSVGKTTTTAFIEQILNMSTIFFQHRKTGIMLNILFVKWGETSPRRIQYIFRK